MKLGFWLANACTAMNLVCGLISLELAVEGQYSLAVLAVLGSMIFDALDGKVARLFSASGSDFGKELDSLCDVVSFGVAPAFLLYRMLLQQMGLAGMLVGITFAVCGALRLARFNTNVSIPGKGFTGMPITGAGGILAATALHWQWLTAWGMAAFTLLLAFLMVSRIRYPDLKAVPFLKRPAGILLSILAHCSVLLLCSGVAFFAAHALYLQWFSLHISGKQKSNYLGAMFRCVWIGANEI